MRKGGDSPSTLGEGSRWSARWLLEGEGKHDTLRYHAAAGDWRAGEAVKLTGCCCWVFSRWASLRYLSGQEQWSPAWTMKKRPAEEIQGCIFESL